jgi:hypothetical protein
MDLEELEEAVSGRKYEVSFEREIDLVSEE